MKLWKIAVVLAVVAAFGLGITTAYAQDKPAVEPPKKAPEPGKEPAKEPPKEPAKVEAQPLCPVMGKPVDFCVMTVTADGPVYFCCKDCIAKFEADPKKFAEKVAEQRKALAKLTRVQVTCPVTGKPIDKTVVLEQEGQKIYFADKGCIEQYKKDAAKLKAKLDTCYTYQAKCPVSGKPIDPAFFTATANGVKVFFCCKDCPATFQKDLDKYLPALKTQGYHFKAEDFKAKPATPAPPAKPEPAKPDEKKPDKKG